MTLTTGYPTIEHGWGAKWGASGGSAPLDGFVDVTGRTQGTVSAQRGRQYELDQVQSGTMNVVLGNNDGVLDPTNTAGPFAGHIAPYQPYRLRAQYPATRNLLSPAIAETTGVALGAVDQSVNGPDMFGPAPTVVASASAYVGTNVWQCAVLTSQAANSYILETQQPAIKAGQLYVFTIQVRNITDATTLQVNLAISWRDATGASIGPALSTPVTLTGSSTATGWTELTISGTAPANSANAITGLINTTTAAANCTIQTDGWQWEKDAKTAYQTPGTWYPIYAGFVERWPQSWELDQSYSVVQPTAVDAFALLAQRKLNDPLAEEINLLNPRFLYKLDDPSGSQQATDATGNNGPAGINVSKFGPGSLVFGTDHGSGYTGDSGTVATFNNPDPGTNFEDPATYIDLATAGITGPANVSGDWSRLFAFRYTGPLPTTGNAAMWTSFDQHSSGYGARLVWSINTSGGLVLSMYGPGATVGYDFAAGVITNVVDGNWHLALAAYSHANASLTLQVDGAGGTYTGVNPAAEPVGMASDSIGAWIEPGTQNSAYNYKGDMSFCAEFPTALSTTQSNTLYNAWKNSFAGESTDTRYARILNYAGYKSRTKISAGMTRSMGPAQLDGQDALSALQDVVDTEGGEHFVDASGAIVFRARSYRYNTVAPAYTFGGNTAGGEFPFEEMDLDYDPTHLGNIAEVTQASTGQVFTAQDATSQNAFFPRTLTRTVNSSSAFECQDASSYLVSRYKNPATRVSMLKLNPAAYPALWPVCLSLELGMRIRIIRRPLGRPAITVDAFVEQITWDMDGSNQAFVTLQCSPVDLTPYGVFAAWHTTMQACSSGATTLTINAPQDNLNPLAAQLAPGTVLTISPTGTTSKENVTVQSVSSSGSPWTTGTITLTAGTAHSHSNGATICEALPAGVTDVTTWDAVSKFDSHAFAY